MCCCAARTHEKGERLPPGAACAVASGQALQPKRLTGGLTTGSRLRRACTPFLIEKFPGKPKPITIQAHSHAPLPRHGSTYLSGKTVQTNRATSMRSWSSRSKKKVPRCWNNSNHYPSSRALDGRCTRTDSCAWHGCGMPRHGPVAWCAMATQGTSTPRRICGAAVRTQANSPTFTASPE